MCYPNDPDELLRIELMSRTLDAVEAILASPRRQTPRCESCGRIKPDLCSLCSDELRADKFPRGCP